MDHLTNTLNNIYIKKGSKTFARLHQDIVLLALVISVPSSHRWNPPWGRSDDSVTSCAVLRNLHNYRSGFRVLNDQMFISEIMFQDDRFFNCPCPGNKIIIKGNRLVCGYFMLAVVRAAWNSRQVPFKSSIPDCWNSYIPVHPSMRPYTWSHTGWSPLFYEVV